MGNATIVEDRPPMLPGFKPGEEVGDFQIIRKVGSGGWASVYLARQKSLDREIALKVSPNNGREARVMANLEHDHILKVFSEWTDPQRNLRFICMPYVPGTSLEKIFDVLLKDRTRERSGAGILAILDECVQEAVEFDPASLRYREELARLDFTEAVLWIGAGLAETLAYAHQRGILHLDVKPGNLLFNSFGRFLLSDFNVALTKNSSVKEGLANFGGTLGYMAPEQSAVFTSKDRETAIQKIDGRADVYSVGIILREFMALAFGATSSGLRPWEAVIARSVDPDPSRRFPDAAAFGRALRGALEMYRIERELPRENVFIRFSGRHPLASLILYALVPQFAASAVNILYNQLLIVSRLDPMQQDFFLNLMLTYNLFIYSLCVSLWARLLSRLAKDLKSVVGEPEKEAAIRSRLLQLPRYVSAIIAFGWLPTGILFPLFINRWAGPVTGEVFGHFFVSCFFSWLLATAYSGLFIELVCVRVFYPRFWRLAEEVKNTASKELAGIAAWAHMLHWLANFVPSIGALTLLLTAAYPPTADRFQTLTWLASLLVVMSLAGMALGNRRNNQLLKTLRAFTSQSEL